jgi:hypothetical protein
LISTSGTIGLTALLFLNFEVKRVELYEYEHSEDRKLRYRLKRRQRQATGMTAGT